MAKPADALVEVDLNKCMGTGACAFARPDVFALREEGWAEVIGPVDGEDKVLRQVVAECPTGALSMLPC
jgi:ferredoxin